MTDSRQPNLARQALPAVLLAISGGALVFLVDDLGPAITADPDPLSSVPSSVTSQPTGPTVPVSVVPSTPTPSTIAPDTVPSPGSVAPPTTAPVTTPPTTRPAAPALTGSFTATSDRACTGEPVTGPGISFRWGTVRLQALFTAEKALCAITVLEYPNDRGRSVSINTYALPVYSKEAVQADAASISVISGATESWEAYTAGLQALLDGVR